MSARSQGEGGGEPIKKCFHWGGGAFSTLKGALFFIWKAFFLLLEALFLIFGGHFLHMGDLIFFYVEKFLGLSPPTKLSAGPHALTAKLIHVCRLWEIERNCEIYLLKHFRAHFHIMLRKSMK